jgi:hypothetical protein
MSILLPIRSRSASLPKVLGASFALVALLGVQSIGALTAFAGAYVTLDSFSGTPGSTINVSGGGWTAGDTVNIFFGPATGTPAAVVTVGSDSSFTASAMVPDMEPQGALAVTAVDTTNSYQAGNSYYVIPLSATVTDSAVSHAPYAVVPVRGTGYAPNEPITISLAGAIASTTADASGSFTGTITIPNVPSTLYHLSATGNLSGATAFDYFWVDAFYPNASPSTYYLMPGAALSFTGSGFASNEVITVTQQGGATTTLSSFTADAAGSFTAAGSFNVPASDNGQTVTFVLTGQTSGQTTSAGVTIGNYYAYASPTSYYLLPGQTETFTGGGFAANEKVDVFAGSNASSTVSLTTDATGSFMNAGSILVPFGSANNIAFTLKGEESRAQAATTIAVGGYFPNLSPSAYYVTPNTSITIAGSGYAPNEGITLSVSGNATTTSATTTAMGTFNAPVTIPFSASGSATITAVGNQSMASGAVSVALAHFYPQITPYSWFVYPGGAISYSGTNFVPGETVTMTTGVGTSAATSTLTADANGNIQTATSTVPYNAVGSFSAHFVGSLSQSPTTISIAVGTLSAYLSADNYSSTQGNTVHITGYSFAPGEVVTVTSGAFSTTTTADANGTTAAVAVTTPYGASSAHITFTGISSGATAAINISLLSFNGFITSTSYYAQPGTSVTISGTGFAPNELVTVGDGLATTTAMATSSGAFMSPLTLPFTSSASITVVATGQTSGATSGLAIALAPFIPQVSPSTYYTLPGTTVTFTGTGFAPSEIVAVKFNDSTVSPVTADTTGAFTYSYMIPFGSTHASISFIGETSGSGVIDTLSLATYSAYITLSNYYGIGGSANTVSGSGFAANEPVTLSFNGVAFASTTANAMGAIAFATHIPYSTPGNKPLSATGAQSGASAGTNFTVAPVYPDFELGAYAGAPGTAVDLIGSNYMPNETVDITTDRTTGTVASFTTDAAGNFNNSSFVIPTSFTGGTLVITAVGEHSLTPLGITYYVTGS